MTEAPSFPHITGFYADLERREIGFTLEIPVEPMFVFTIQRQPDEAECAGTPPEPTGYDTD